MTGQREAEPQTSRLPRVEDDAHQQLRLGDQPPEAPMPAGRRFWTDADILAELREIEAELRGIIRRADLRPYVVTGRCADRLAKLCRDLEPIGGDS